MSYIGKHIQKPDITAIYNVQYGTRPIGNTQKLRRTYSKDREGRLQLDPDIIKWVNQKNIGNDQLKYECLQIGGLNGPKDIRVSAMAVFWQKVVEF